MNNEQYWQERLLTRENDMNKRMEKLSKEMTTLYAEAIDNINDDIVKYLGYQEAELDKLDVPSMYKELNSKTLSPIDMDTYRRRADVLLAKWEVMPDGMQKDMIMAEMRVLRTRQQLTIYEAIKSSINMHLTDYAVTLDRATESFLADEYTEAYLYSHYEQAMTIGTAMPIAINREAIIELVNTPFDGANFSTYVWDNRDAMVKTLTKKVSDIIIRGRGVKDVARELKAFLNPERGKKYGEYATKRILQTESSRMFNVARTNGMKERGKKYYKILAEFDSKTCSKCRKHDGQRFEIGNEVLPFHPNCRCSVISDKDDGSRYNKDEAVYEYEGKIYTQEEYDKIKKDISNKSLVKKTFKPVDAMSYKKWKEEFVK